MADGVKQIRAIMNRPENALCADCMGATPQWASSTFGAFICLKCSGIHRSLGTHITLVRSCTLDSWPPQMLAVMDAVGNVKANEYWEANLPPNFVRPTHANQMAMRRFIEQKYVEKKFADRNRLPPHLLLVKQSEPHDEASRKAVTKELPHKNVNPSPAMSRSQSTDVDSAVASITGSRGKIRIRHTRVAKDKSMTRSNSSVVRTQPAANISTKESEDDFDDFFKEDLPVKTTLKPIQKVAPVSANPKPKKEITKQGTKEAHVVAVSPKQVEDDYESESELEQQPEIVIDATSEELEDVDDFFNADDDDAPKVIKQLPPIPAEEPRKMRRSSSLESPSNMQAANEASRKYRFDDAPNPFAPAPIPQKPTQSSVENVATKPTPKRPQFIDDAPNPFLEIEKKTINKQIEEKTKESQNEEEQDFEDQNKLPDINYVDDDDEDIDDFFSDEPKPKKPKKNKPELAPEQPKKTTMEACSYVPPVEVYHPANPDPPEVIEKLKEGIEHAKEGVKHGIEFVKERMKFFFSDGNELPPGVQAPSPSNQPSRQINTQTNSNVAVRSQTRTMTAAKSVDDFFNEPEAPPPRPAARPIQPAPAGPQKVYKIKKRTAKATVEPVRTQRKTAPKSLSVDDAVEDLLGDLDNRPGHRRQRK